MTEAEHLENMEFIRQASENAKVALVLEEIKDEVNKLKKVSDGNKVYVGINDVFDIIDKHTNVTESEVKKCFTTSHKDSIISSKGGGIICRQKQ